MKKVLKYLLITLGGILVVLLALAVYLAATFNPNDYKPQAVQLVKDKFDRTLAINGDIKLSFYPALGAELGRISLSEHGSAKEFAAVDSARVSLQLMPLLSRELVVSQVEVRGLRANLVKNKNGSSNIDDLTAGEASKPAKPDQTGKPSEAEQQGQKPIAFNIDHVLIEDASLSYADEGSGAKYAVNKLSLKTGKIVAGSPSDISLGFTVGATQPKVNVDIQLKTRLSFAPDTKRFKLEGLDLGVKGEAAGINPLALSLKGSVEGDATMVKSDELALEFNAQQDGKTIKGKLTTSLAVAHETKIIDLKKLLVSLSLSDPKSAPLAINVTGSIHADIPKQRVTVDFSTKFDESTITGRAGVTHFSPPAYIFDLNIDKLDVDRYTGEKKSESAKPASGAKAAADQPEQPLDFSALKTLQANGSIKIGALTVAKLKAQNVHLDVKAGNGRVDMNPLTASLYQGSVRGSLALVATAVPQIAVKQQLTAISIGPLLKDAIDKDLLEGRGDVSLDVSGQGATVTEIKKALDGSAALSLTNGALKGINLGETLRNAKAKIGSLAGGESTKASNAAEKTDFTELKASFAIKNGVAHNSDLSLKSPLLRLGGEGDINIGTSSMDYLAKATLVASAEGQGGKSAADLSGITVPVRISGPFAALSYKLDFNALLSGLAQQKLDAKKDELKAKAEDKLKGRLKGLFGR